MVEFKDRLMELMNEIGIKTPEELSEKLKDDNHLHPNTIRNYLKGKSPKDFEKYKILADFFGVTTDYLQGYSNARTINIDIKNICNKYGLSEKSLETLEGINNGSFIEKRREKYNIEEYKKLPKTVDKTIIKSINFLLEDMLNCTNNNKLSLLELISYILYMDNDFRAEGFGGINGYGLHFQLEGIDALLPKLHLLLNDARNSIKKEGEKNECKRNRKK